MNVRRIGLIALILAAPALPVGAYFIGAQVNQTTDLVQRINDERARNVRTNCEEQNLRHDNTIRRLDELVARLPAARREAKRAGTVFLLEALAPRRDCGALVRSQVGHP